MIGAYEDRTQAEQYPPVIAANGQGIWYQDYGCELDSPAHTRNGYVSSAVLLYDAEYVTLQDLELTNSGQDIIGERYSASDKMNRTGVAVAARDKGVRSGITLRNLVIHDVNGNVYDKHMNNGGIYMTAQKPIAKEHRSCAFPGCDSRRLLCRPGEPLGNCSRLYLCACRFCRSRAFGRSVFKVWTRKYYDSG